MQKVCHELCKDGMCCNVLKKREIMMGRRFAARFSIV